MLLGRLRIRGKLALLVTIPLVAVVVLAVPVVQGRVDQAQRAGDTARSVRVAGLVGSLIQDVQQERLLSLGLLGRMVDPNRFQSQVATVTTRVADVRGGLGAKPDPGVVKALDAVQTLTPLRASVQQGTAAPDKLTVGYNGVIKGLIDALRLEDGVDLKTAAGRQVIALDAALRTDEDISLATADLFVAVLARDIRALSLYLTDVAVLTAQSARITQFASASQVALYNQIQGVATARLGNDFNGGAGADPAASFAKLTPQVVFPALESLIGVGRVVEQRIINDVTGQVNQQQRRALITAYSVGGVALLVLLLAVLLVIVVGRAVVRPLTRLTTSADRVARVTEAELVRVADDETEAAAPIQLDPIQVSGRDEVGDLARAFERVQGTAARLVERQVASRRNVAQMFGHVGRRTQNLVGRQISLIDRLERDEADHERLQLLYRLDHVSSRLSRNAGSLVVLSGETSTNEHINPLPLTDVVRLALGEIEDYVRVDVDVPPGLALAPGVVNDLVLVLAELMENATVFSPPHTRVTVTAQQASFGAQIAVIDHGIGLSPERLAEENARLARRERLDLAPTEVLGLFVVGRLARRHGLGVALWPTPGGGLTATIAIGDALLTAAPVPVTATVGYPAPASPAPIGAGVPVAGQLPVAGYAQAAAPAGIPRALTSVPFDVHALTRASESIETGGQWNAFVPPLRRRAAQPDPVPPGPAVAAPPLRQRVPGAQFPAEAGARPAGPPPAPPPAPAPADAALAQAMVDEFEAGVRRAKRQAVDRPAPQLVAPGRAAVSAAPLTRRVPGATLAAIEGTAPLGTALPQQPPPNPDEARDLVQQFESGVLRALHDARSDHQ